MQSCSLLLHKIKYGNTSTLTEKLECILLVKRFLQESQGINKKETVGEGTEWRPQGERAVTVMPSYVMRAMGAIITPGPHSWGEQAFEHSDASDLFHASDTGDISSSLESTTVFKVYPSVQLYMALLWKKKWRCILKVSSTAPELWGNKRWENISRWK